jgi:hypothetical protein
MTLIKYGGKEFDAEVFQNMIDAGLVGAKHDTSSATPSAQALNGPFPGNNAIYGPFSGAGVRPGMIGTLARVNSIVRALPFRKSVNYNELIEIMTGVTEGSGNNSTSACATAPKAGDLKVMRRVANFGIVHEGTKVDDVTQAGMRRDYADIDRTLWNTASAENPMLPQAPGIDGDGLVSSRLRSSFYTLGVDIERNYSRALWDGVAGTEDNTWRGIARQHDGISALVKTGYADSVTGLASPAVDSAIFSHNQLVTAASSVFVNNLVNLIYSLIQRAQSLQIGDVRWVLGMRSDLFREVAKQVAADMPTWTNAGTSTAPMNMDAVMTYNNFVAMFNNNYLTIEGQNIGVVLDDSIPRETLANNTYKSDIYMLPISGLGQPLTYIQYFDMGNPQAEELANGFGIDGESRVINGGLYRVFKRVTKGCVEYDVFARLRLIMEAPFLAGRLDDVWYASSIKGNDPIPGMSYYKNGGVTYR